MKHLKIVMSVIITTVILNSCDKEGEMTRVSLANKKDIPSSLSLLATSYCRTINAIADHIDDTLVIRCQGVPALIDNIDTFKLKYVDSLAIGVGKNVYCGFTGDYSVAHVKGPNGQYVSTSELGNLYFYIYTDFYQLEQDSFYTIVNRRFLYNTADSPFK